MTIELNKEKLSPDIEVSFIVSIDVNDENTKWMNDFDIQNQFEDLYPDRKVRVMGYEDGSKQYFWDVDILK